MTSGRWQVTSSKWWVATRLIGALGLVIVLALVGCTGDRSEEPTAKPVETVETVELEHIRLPMGYIPNVQFAPVYVAVERGYFAQEGIEVEFDYSFETDGIQLVAAGELPFSIASGEQVILARAQGLPVVYVTEWWQRFPVAVASLAETGIESPADLAGRTVGVPELFGASYIGWQALLNAAGLDPSEVKLQAIGYSQAPSLSEGRVEAAVVYANNEPVVLAQEGLAVNVILVADYADIVSNGLVASEKVIAERPELVRRFVRAFLRGVADTLADPDAAFEISTHYVEGLAESAELGRAVLEATLPYWQTDRLGYSEASTWEQSQQVMRDAGLLDETVPVDTLFTNEFLPDE
jgi:NitT/TauT family transport system substrate-binding protein